MVINPVATLSKQKGKNTEISNRLTPQGKRIGMIPTWPSHPAPCLVLGRIWSKEGKAAWN